MAEALAALSKAVILSQGMTCRYASWLSVALAGDATERASQRSWEMPISVKTLARPHTWVPTLIERLCRQRVLSAACLAPPIRTYTLCQPIKSQKGGLHYSLPNCSFLLFQMTQARVFGGTVP
jgi:hypothetical protein